MKLNPDCIRDIMLTLEDMTGITLNGYYQFARVTHSSVASELSEKYRSTEIAYTLIQLAESDYIKMQFEYDKRHLAVNIGNILYITPKGHEFISHIQSNERWTTKIKPAIRLFGSVSLSVVEAISKGVANAALERITPN